MVVLSHGLWLQLFGGDQAAIGRLVTLDGKGYTVVGVMPAAFAFPDEGTQLWMPLGQAFVTQPDMETNPDFQALSTIARLRDGIEMPRMQSDLAIVAARQNASPGLQPPGYATMRLRDEDAGDTRTPLLVLLAVVGFVLVFGCVNAANLLLARSTARQREFAVRRALGAGRGRLMGQPSPRASCCRWSAVPWGWSSRRSACPPFSARGRPCCRAPTRSAWTLRPWCMRW